MTAPARNTICLWFDRGAEEAARFLPLGSSCRVCPRVGCHARREPSILREEF